jgi:hypothetical protein
MKTTKNTKTVTLLVEVVLVAWLAIVFLLGARGLFTTPLGRPPLPMLLGVVLPLILFLIPFRVSHDFHDFVMTFDLRLAAGIQAWRFAGRRARIYTSKRSAGRATRA